MGLVASGSAAKTFLNRFPSLHAKLGPIKSGSYPVARRFVLWLRHGFAVPTYSALEFCPVIWIVVPEQSLDTVLHNLAAQISIRKTMVVICGSQRDSTDFGFLHARGMRVATLNVIEDTRQSSFVAEGHRDTLRFLRTTLDADRRKLVAIRSGAKAGYLAGIHLMTHLLRALVTSSINCLQAAGMTRTEALELATQLAAKSIKAHGRTGAKPWSRSELHDLRQALDQRTDELRRICPVESGVYANAVVLALEYFEHLSAPPKARTHHA